MTTRPLRHRLKPLCGRCLRSCCPGAAAQPWLCHLASPGMRQHASAAALARINQPGGVVLPDHQGAQP